MDKFYLKVIAYIFLSTGCEDGDVRLQDRVSLSSGRVEFCKYRTWWSVCNEGWDNNDARVVCGQLGFNNPEGIHTLVLTVIILHDIPDARVVNVFVTAEGTPVSLSQVDCSGLETQLSECINTTTKSDCVIAGVTCEKIS